MPLTSHHALPAVNASSEHRPCRVLVADDEQVNREILTRMLARNGYDASSVESGLALLNKLDIESFDLILLDVMMPEMAGLNVSAGSASGFPIGELPVIMVRGSGRRMVSAFRAGPTIM
jgi:CheY-like chemotaxis protein